MSRGQRPAAASPEVTGQRVMNMLWSYAYARKEDQLDRYLAGLPVDQLRFFADSGAHSARTLGIHIGIDGYAEWVKRWQPWFTIYANLDVIGAPAKTRDNQTYLEEVHGLEPMPVFHTGEPFSVLERYLADGYTYIALGKLLGNPVPVLRPWLKQAFRIAHGTAVFHGFGMTSMQLLREFPFYSVDSSTWGAAYRFGSLRVFHQGRWITIRLRNRDSVHRNRAAIDAYGLPYRTLTGAGYDRARVAAASAEAMYRAADWMRRIHGPITLPPGKGYPRQGHAAKVLPAAPREPLTQYLADSWSGAHSWHAGALVIYLAESSRRQHDIHAAGTPREATR